MPNISRVTTLKVLTNSLSVAEHVQTVLSSCAQTLYALRILRAHGMDDTDLQTVYRSVVIAKLTYASSAWWGFTSARDQQKLDAFISSDEFRVVALFHQTSRRLRNYVPQPAQPMKDCLIRFSRTKLTRWTISSHRYQRPLSTTIFANVDTT